jgi:glycosyltransferase involved in cell wall biosynthesis
MTQTVGLAMLVKDEAETLPKTLPEMVWAIDSWTIMDTGSTDGSQQVASELLADRPGLIIERPFDGFGPARTALLEESRKRCDYTLMLDADHTLHINGERPHLEADAYLVKINGNLEWRLPLLTKSKHPFEYRGVAHSYLASRQPVSVRREPTDWISIDGGPGASREKLEGDVKLLEREWLEHPDDTRTTFYLAQTYRDLDMPEKAIRFYLLRAEMGGFEEERWYARYQAGVLLGGYVEGLQGAEQLVKAWRERPSRAESIRALARLAATVADKIDVPDDTLFVTPSAYGRKN